MVSLLPWFCTLAADPSIAPAGAGFPFRGLVLVYPMIRGLGYSLRMASLSLPSRLATFDFTPAFGAGADTWLEPPMTLVAAVTLATAIALEAALRTRRRRTVRRVLSIWSLVSVVLVMAIAFAAPMFRKDGRKPAVTILTADQPLIDDLGLRDHCTVTIDEDHRWAIPD